MNIHIGERTRAMISIPFRALALHVHKRLHAGSARPVAIVIELARQPQRRLDARLPGDVKHALALQTAEDVVVLERAVHVLAPPALRRVLYLRKREFFAR